MRPVQGKAISMAEANATVQAFVIDGPAQRSHRDLAWFGPGHNPSSLRLARNLSTMSAFLVRRPLYEAKETVQVHLRSSVTDADQNPEWLSHHYLPVLPTSIKVSLRRKRLIAQFAKKSPSMDLAKCKQYKIEPLCSLCCNQAPSKSATLSAH